MMFASAMMSRSPTVVMADGNPAYEYSFPQQNTPSSSGWFSGLRAKISQLSSISEWMSQLGVVRENDRRRMPAGSTGSPSTPPVVEDYDDHTISYNSISLDEQGFAPEPEEDQWDWTSCLLADLDSTHSWNDTLEQQHFGPLQGLLTLGSRKKAQGHQFSAVSLLHPTWCDKCGDFIWGILKQASKCDKCNYTCHQRCRELVTLDCRSAGSSLASGEFPSIYPKLNDGTLGTIPKELNLPPLCSPSRADSDKENSVENPLFSPSKINSSTLPHSFAPLPSMDNKIQFMRDERGQTLRVEELYVKEDTPFEWSPCYQELQLNEKIEEFNRLSGAEHMIVSPDGASFSGHIQIQMNFTRPISVVAGEGPPTVFDVVNTGKSTATAKKRTITSFFLPRNTIKTININSAMTTRQMIVTLLKKFRVADNPRKFALYECRQETNEENCTLLRKLVRVGDDVCPLKVVLGWGSANSGNALVLQENDTGDILWDAFEVPELENFLRILGMEERQYQWQIQQRYNQYKYAVDMELRRRGHDVSEASAPPESPSSTLKYRSGSTDAFGTSDSLVLTEEEPEYVNIEQLRLQQSTRL